MHPSLLDRLDRQRRSAHDPSSGPEVLREFSPDRTVCGVVYSACTSDRIDDVIQREKARADAQRYAIDWKVHGHDEPHDLGERLVAAGFEPEAREQLLALALDERAIDRFPTTRAVIERVSGAAGLDAVAEISREIGRSHVEQERAGFARILETQPHHMSIMVASVDDVPASCGRVYYYDVGGYAELCGGRTKTTFRSRGLYLAIVRARLVEALGRGYAVVTVDALPTSEPLLRKRGFERVTWTQPFIYTPSSS